MRHSYTFVLQKSYYHKLEKKIHFKSVLKYHTHRVIILSSLQFINFLNIRLLKFNSFCAKKIKKMKYLFISMVIYSLYNNLGFFYSVFYRTLIIKKKHLYVLEEEFSENYLFMYKKEYVEELKV